MQLIDLSREIHHKMARFPNHPTVIIAPFQPMQKSASPTAIRFPPR